MEVRTPNSSQFPPAGYTLSNVTLSGVVFEETLNGRAPIEGVGVYCELCSEGTHTWASTDSNGFYKFTGVWTGPSHFPASLLIRKDGMPILKDSQEQLRRTTSALAGER